MKTMLRLRAWVLVMLMLVATARAAEMNAVPGQVQFSGNIATAGATTGVTFSLFNEQSGGAALWVETQNVSVAEGGGYSALLGAATEGGIPQSIFANGEARWLEVSYTDASGAAVTQPRVWMKPAASRRSAMCCPRRRSRAAERPTPSPDGPTAPTAWWPTQS
jgi:hypothetical protein